MLPQEVFTKRLRGRNVVPAENLTTLLPGYVYWGTLPGEGAEDTAVLSDVTEPLTSNIHYIAVWWFPQP